MNEDPTRYMQQNQPPRNPYGQGGNEPEKPGMSGGAKFTIALLTAVVIGLVIALAILVADTGDNDTTDSTTAPIEQPSGTNPEPEGTEPETEPEVDPGGNGGSGDGGNGGGGGGAPLNDEGGQGQGGGAAL